MPPADRPQEPESPEWVDWLKVAYEVMPPAALERLLSTVDMLVTDRNNDADLLRATCQERDTLREMVGRLVPDDESPFYRDEERGDFCFFCGAEEESRRVPVPGAFDGYHQRTRWEDVTEHRDDCAWTAARAVLREVPANRRTKAMCSACGLADWPCPSLDCPGVPANPQEDA